MKNSKVSIQIKRNNFTEQQKEEMWEVYHQYYHYSREDFMQRIPQNNYYALYTDGERLVGFTGLRVHRIKNHSGRKFLIYFGQTIIGKGYRGKSLIPRTGAKLCFRFFTDIISSKVYFWADCLTYKAYLVFAKTVEEYYPSYQRPNPSGIQEVIDRIGMMNYKDTYCPETGTVKKAKVLVADTTSFQIRPEYRADPDVDFFQMANPEYRNGNGLITVAPMHWKNISILLKRFLWGKPKKKGMARKPIISRKRRQEVGLI